MFVYPERELVKFNAFPCTILRKLNRFVVEVRVGGEIVKAHNVNTGRLRDLIWEGNEAYCSEKSGGKLKYKLIAAKTPFGFAVVDTNLQELALQKAFELGYLSWTKGCSVRRRPRKGKSFFDFELECEEKIVVEVKSADLAGPLGEGMWPDCPTERGRKHLHELAEMEGRRVVLFVVGFPKACCFVPYCKGDPLACDALVYAASKGVELRAAGMYFDPPGSIKLYAELPVLLMDGKVQPPPRALF